MPAALRTVARVAIAGLTASSASEMETETARTVPRSDAVSGTTLSVEPASILPMVITTGSNALIRRVTNVCRAMTISAAIGTGSIASCGIDA